MKTAVAAITRNVADAGLVNLPYAESLGANGIDLRSYVF